MYDDLEDWARKHARNDDPHTSHEAAPLTPSKVTHMDLLVQTYARVWPRAMTAEEASVQSGLEYYETSKRISDLLQEGKLIWTGFTATGSSGRQQRIHALPRPPK